MFIISVQYKIGTLTIRELCCCVVKIFSGIVSLLRGGMSELTAISPILSNRFQSYIDCLNTILRARTLLSVWCLMQIAVVDVLFGIAIRRALAVG